MEAPQTFTLPNELWIRVLQNLDNEEDIAVLWTTCRHVCTAFKDATESIFRERHLPKTRINFDLGELTEDPHGRRMIDFTLTADFEFSELSEDGCTATFQLEEDTPEELMAPTKERMQTHIGNMDVGAPKHTIQIRRDINDGPIPDLSFDQDKCELSCNWRNLLTAFYGEETLAERLTNEWLDSKRTYLEELKAKMARGQIGAERAISNAILEIGNGEEIGRRSARRARIRHQFRERGINWDPETDDSGKEDDALTKLRILKQFASTEAFSDEEYSDEWEDEDEDEESGLDDEEDDSSDDQ